MSVMPKQLIANAIHVDAFVFSILRKPHSLVAFYLGLIADFLYVVPQVNLVIDTDLIYL